MILELISAMKGFVAAKAEYDRISGALEEARRTGYGVVPPAIDEMELDEPEIVRQGSRFGVRLRARASGLHVIRVDIESEISPIVGTEQQSEALVQSLLATFEQEPGAIWQTNLFGKSLYDLVRDGMAGKGAMQPAVQQRLQTTLQRIVNEGCKRASSVSCSDALGNTKGRGSNCRGPFFLAQEAGMQHYRTDLAREARDLAGGRQSGVEQAREQRDGMTIERIEITTDAAARRLDKPRGRYVTIDTDEIPAHDPALFAAVTEQIAGELQALLGALPAEADVLGRGALATASSRPTRSGRKQVDRIYVTRHFPHRRAGARAGGACARCRPWRPGCSAPPASRPARSCAASYRARARRRSSAWDALAARSTGRINRTVQLSDGGHQPRLGHRQPPANALSRETLGVPVVAVGVPMVVYALDHRGGRGRPHRRARQPARRRGGAAPTGRRGRNASTLARSSSRPRRSTRSSATRRRCWPTASTGCCSGSALPNSRHCLVKRRIPSYGGGRCRCRGCEPGAGGAGGRRRACA